MMSLYVPKYQAGHAQTEEMNTQIRTLRVHMYANLHCTAWPAKALVLNILKPKHHLDTGRHNHTGRQTNLQTLRLTQKYTQMQMQINAM